MATCLENKPYSIALLEANGNPPPGKRDKPDQPPDSKKFQYLKDIDKRSEEQLERAREIDEGYNMTVNHLENHPMWDKMFGSTEKANDSDDDDD